MTPVTGVLALVRCKLYTCDPQLDDSRGWVARINQGELQSVKGPPPGFVGSMLARNASGGGGLRYTYSLLWSAAGSAAEVGQHPPQTARSGHGTILRGNRVGSRLEFASFAARTDGPQGPCGCSVRAAKRTNVAWPPLTKC